MLDRVKNAMFQIKDYFDSEENGTFEDNSKSLLDMVDDAKREWLAAKEYFESVSDPDLIDYAIHSMEATEKRYNYLLKKVKQMNLEEIK